MPSSSGNAFLIESRFTENLVECKKAAPNPLTGIGHAALLQNLLDLAILAEGAVDHVVGEIHAGRERKAGVPHIDLFDDGAKGLQGASNGGA